MMMFGYEVGSTQVVVIGRSNLAQDPRGTRRVQKKGPKKERVCGCALCTLSQLHSVAARVITFLAQRCEFFSK